MPPADRSALAPATPDALANGRNGHIANPGKNGNGHNGHSAVRDATASYLSALPANVTPIRPIVSRAAPRLEDEVRADAVIQTLLDHGIELADVQPLEDDE